VDKGAANGPKAARLREHSAAWNAGSEKRPSYSLESLALSSIGGSGNCRCCCSVGGHSSNVRVRCTFGQFTRGGDFRSGALS